MSDDENLPAEPADESAEPPPPPTPLPPAVKAAIDNAVWRKVRAKQWP